MTSVLSTEESSHNQEIKDKKNIKDFYPISVKIFHRSLLELIKEMLKHLESVNG